ncbi:MAG: hypothetical protein R6U50_13625 [Desulfobacterales bacterium]
MLEEPVTRVLKTCIATGRSADAAGPMAGLLPSGTIKLIYIEGGGRHIYDGRAWGDVGCMELCFDVSELQGTVAEMEGKGMDIYLPPVMMNMGTGSKGFAAYIRDPDGTTVELVEVKTIFRSKRFVYTM